MRLLHTLSGLLAIAGLAAGLNVLVLKQTVFELSVVAPLALGAVAGAVWLVLALSSVTADATREGKALYGLNTIVTTILFVGICVVVYAFVLHWNKSWDLTQEGRRELADQTVQVLETLNKDVNVVGFFMQIDDELVRIAFDKTKRFLEQCQSHTQKLHVEFLDPQVDRPQLEAMNITHASTQGTIVIRCGQNQKVITLSGGSPRLEEREFTNALVNVMRDAQPKVCFLTGHGERSIDDQDPRLGGSVLKQLLYGEAYRAERIAIAITHAEVPPDCDVLVINGLGLKGPQADLHPEEIRAIQAFLDQGGRLLVLLDPWQRLAGAYKQVEQLCPWLEGRYGIMVGSNMVVSPTSKWQVEVSSDTSLFDDPLPDGSGGVPTSFVGGLNGAHAITRNFDQRMLMSAARTVRLGKGLPDRVVGAELLRTTPDFFAETDLATLGASGKAVQNDGEEGGPLPMAVAVTAKTNFQVGDSGQTRDARIVVVGDSDFVSNGQLTVIPGNLNFILNALAWLTESEELIAIRSTGKEDPPIILSDFDERVLVYISVLGTVQAVVAAGLIVFLWRRKYQ